MGSRIGSRWFVGIGVIAAALALGGPSAADDLDALTRPEDFKLRETQVVHVDDVFTGRNDERRAEVYVRALARFGEPVTQLHPAHFEVREDGRTIDVGDLTAQPLKDSGLGLTCVLLVDASRSMEGESFERAKEAALELLQRLGSADRVAVLRFAGAPEPVVGFDESRAKAEVLVRSLEIEENSLNTTLWDAVYAGIELVRKTEGLPRRTFLVVLSDGNDGGSQHSLEQVVQLAQGDQTQPQVLVFTLGYRRLGGGGLAALRTLAEQTDAEFFEVGKEGELHSFYEHILKQMAESYVLTFPTGLDGMDHEVEVVVEGHKGSRRVLYRDLPRPVWPWLAGGGAVLLAALAWLLVVRLRSPGQLVFVDGPSTGEVISLRPGRMRIGSRSDNDVVIDTPTVSRCHAELTVAGSRVEIEDLHSRNGTFVNGAPIRRSPIQPGDRIEIADVALRYER